MDLENSLYNKILKPEKTNTKLNRPNEINNLIMSKTRITTQLVV